MSRLAIALAVLTTICFGFDLLTEDFNSAWTTNSPPPGWRIYHSDTLVQGSDDWNPRNASSLPWITHGSRYAAIYWNLTPDPTPDSLVSPLINCIGYDNVTLTCSTYFLRKLPISYVAQIRYSVDGGATFPYLIEDYYGDSVLGEQTFVLSQAANRDSVVIAWVFSGDLANINWWCLDDVVVSGDSIPTWDVSCVSILAPPDTIMPVGPLTPAARFANTGIMDQANVPVECNLYASLGGLLLQNWTSTIASLPAGGATNVTFAPPYSFGAPANDLYIEYFCAADSDYNRLNDTLGLVFDVTYLEELGYDDGTAARRSNWPVGHHGWGAKFTPTTYPVYVESAKIWLDCPSNPSFARYQVAVVLPANTGEPSKLLYKSPVLSGATGAAGWNNVWLGATGEEIEITSGSFYLFYLQVGEEQECPSLGRDQLRDAPSGTYWEYRAGSYTPEDVGPGDYMIRAVVNGQPLTSPNRDGRVTHVGVPWYEFVQRPFDAPVVARARVENSGNLDLVGVAVTCSVFGTGPILRFSDEVPISLLASGADSVVQFAPWVPTVAENVTVKVQLYYPSSVPDDVPSNDAKTFGCEIIKGIHTGVSGGYQWIDSDTTGGPTYSWVDPGTDALPTGDEMKIYVPIGFNFPYYDTSYNNVHVCSNGWIALGHDPQTTDSIPKRLPEIAAPNACLYPWWDNLAVGPGFGGGRIHYKNDGSSPNMRFILTWVDANRMGSDTSDLISFQVILHQNGSITYQYNDVTTGDLSFDNARYSTIGIENELGSDGLTYLHARPRMSIRGVNDLANRVAAGRAVRYQKIFRDAAVLDIVQPPVYVFPGDVAPVAKIQNYGTVVDTIFVYLHINPGYADIVTVPALMPGDSMLVPFATWTATRGNFTAVCSVRMNGDFADSNDVYSRQIVVSPWIQREDIPEGPRRRKVKYATMAYIPPGSPYGNRIYAIKGGNESTLWYFDLTTGTWDSVAPMPSTPSNRRPKDGVDVAYDPDHGNFGYLWAIKGGRTPDFYAYDIDADAWIDKRPVYFNRLDYRPPHKGGRIVYEPTFGSDGSIYCIPGNNTNYLWRYDIATDTWTDSVIGPSGAWEKIPEVPVDPGRRSRRCKHGSALIRGDGSIYCVKGSNTLEIYAYSPLQNIWYDTLPFVDLLGPRRKRIKSGASAAYYDNGIYLLKGGNTQELWHYTVPGDSWTRRAEIPISIYGRRRKVKRGSDMVVADTTIFCLKGSYCYEFWEYLPEGDTVLPPASRSRGAPAREGTSGRTPEAMPLGYALAANPSPTRGELAIDYAVPAPTRVEVSIYDRNGSLVRDLYDASSPPGRHRLRWDGRNRLGRLVPSGIYFLTLRTPGVDMTRKLVIQQ